MQQYLAWKFQISQYCSWLKYQGCISKSSNIRLRSFNVQIYLELHRRDLLSYYYLLLSVIPQSSIFLHYYVATPTSQVRPYSVYKIFFRLALSWRRSPSYRNICHEKVNLLLLPVNWKVWIPLSLWLVELSESACTYVTALNMWFLKNYFLIKQEEEIVCSSL